MQRAWPRKVDSQAATRKRTGKAHGHAHASEARGGLRRAVLFPSPICLGYLAKKTALIFPADFPGGVVITPVTDSSFELQITLDNP